MRQQTNKSIGTYGVNYPANGDFLAAADGANDASDHIQQMASACRATRLVLGGYSQGAAVIDIVTAAPLPGLGFTQPLPPAADDHIAAIALFGNPSGRAGGLMSALTPQFGSKTINLCNNGDPILFGRQPVASAPRLRARDDQPGGAFRREQDLTRAAP